MVYANLKIYKLGYFKKKRREISAKCLPAYGSVFVFLWLSVHVPSTKTDFWVTTSDQSGQDLSLTPPPSTPP